METKKRNNKENTSINRNKENVNINKNNKIQGKTYINGRNGKKGSAYIEINDEIQEKAYINKNDKIQEKVYIDGIKESDYIDESDGIKESNALKIIDSFHYNFVSKILMIFIVLGPIFDIVSFTFRNKFDSKISITTFLRPIIPLCVSIYIFFTATKENKKKFLAIAITYIMYAIIHIVISKKLFTGCSDGTIINEIQYIFNFTFLAIDLIIYIYTFIYEGIFQRKEIKSSKNNENNTKIEENIIKEINHKIANCITIMVAIYLLTIFIAIITHTSSPTYIETQTGLKGWVESGNSLSGILVVSLFIILPNIDFKVLKKQKNNKEKINSEKNNQKINQEKTNSEINNKNYDEQNKINIKKSIESSYKNNKATQENEIVFECFKIIVAIFDFVYIITTLGTRTGLIGGFLAIFCYILTESIFNKNKKIIFAGIIFLIIGVTSISIVGSKTLKRRAQVKQSQFTIIDKSTGEVGNMTGDMLDIKDKILDGTLDATFMSEEQKEATLDLYEYAKKHNIAGNNTRRLQLIYNIFLLKHQKNLLYILFGNGFKTNFREMVLENELASLFLNFGIIGFILYAGPIFYVLILSIKEIIKKIKKSSNKKENNNLKEQLMYQLALLLIIALSWFSGYVLFATSNMVVISIVVVLNYCYYSQDNYETRFLKCE